MEVHVRAAGGGMGRWLGVELILKSQERKEWSGGGFRAIELL